MPISDLDLNQIDADLTEVRANVDHGEAEHNPWALQALRVADQLRAALGPAPADGDRITVTVCAHDLRAVLAYGNGHAHMRPATWDRNGMPCNECLALGRLALACQLAMATRPNRSSS